MQAGNRNQMRNAGGACDRPFVFVHRLLIAERERAQHIGAGSWAERVGNALRNARAQTIHAHTAFADRAIACILAYVTGCGDAFA